jgi:RHS repeat-associated protein
VEYYTHDGNKNVSEVVAENGDVAAHYEYAPFGAIVAQRGTTASDNPWRFSSECADDTLALVYYNYRHLEPVTGRWLSRDPIAFLKNLYCYCNNFCLIDWLGLFTFDDFKGKPPEDASHDACTYWGLKGNPGRKETALVGEYTGDACKEAIQRNGKKKKVCPCLKCYRYKARYPDFSFSVSLNREKSWVKDIARNDADLLKHEQVHLKIAEKEAEKEENRIKNTWIEGELNCDAKWAEYNAKVSLANAFQSLYDGAYDNIMDKQNKYDSETEHGTIPDKQDEWNKKYE